MFSPRLLLSIASAFACLALAPAASRAEVVPVAAFDSVLSRFVAGDRVDYRALAREPESLRRFLASTAEARPDSFSRAEQFAFWVNAYNARVLDGVIRRPALKSVIEVGGKIAGVPTLGFFREKARTAGRDLSLNDIESETLRRQFRDPRVHFVLNCASVSCPALPSRALVAAGLDSTLEAATQNFLADHSKNRLGRGRTLEISSIFKWYEEDFRNSGGFATFLFRRWPGPERPAPAKGVKFLPYDWSLNGVW